MVHVRGEPPDPRPPLAAKGPLSDDELVALRAWIKHRAGKPASLGMLVALRLYATLEAERIAIRGTLVELSESPLPGARYAFSVVRDRLDPTFKLP